MAQPPPREEWERLRQLGDGHLASVFLARRAATGELVALKCVEKAKLVRARRTERLLVELAVLRAAPHPFVVGLVAAFQDERWAYLVLEHCAGGDLFELLQRQPHARLPEPAARFYAAEICLALQHLHLHGVIYRDLKAENVLIGASGHCRVADFDLAACVPGSAPTRWRGVPGGGSDGGLVASPFPLSPLLRAAPASPPPPGTASAGRARGTPGPPLAAHPVLSAISLGPSCRPHGAREPGCAGGFGDGCGCGAHKRRSGSGSSAGCGAKLNDAQYGSIVGAPPRGSVAPPRELRRARAAPP